ncbi:MAG: TetR/AcrR family transcriptional regulator [Actinobacteria bacterium]|nr:TetR/AcrR family transcriptional regulator [Actinomycetota bacterium]
MAPSPQRTSTSRERGRRRSERSHRAIIAATQELLVERGYREVTIEGIAARAGVGKQTIYRWWPSRAALVLEAYLSGADAVAPPAGGGTTRQEIRALLDWLIAVLAEPTGGHVVAGLVGDLQNDVDLAEGFHRDVVPARREGMVAALERGRERGDIRADAELEIAVDALHGAVFYRLLLSGEPLDADFVESLTRELLSGLAPAPA